MPRPSKGPLKAKWASELWFALAVGVLTIMGGGCTGSRGATTPSGMTYTIVQQGAGPKAQAGQEVLIHETCTLKDGTLVYSTHTRGTPLKFRVGAKQVVDGLDEAVGDMRAGERRTLVVPPHLSRRTSYPANVPPEATLYYDVELVEILPP